MTNQEKKDYIARQKTGIGHDAGKRLIRNFLLATTVIISGGSQSKAQEIESEKDSTEITAKPKQPLKAGVSYVINNMTDLNTQTYDETVQNADGTLSHGQGTTANAYNRGMVALGASLEKDGFYGKLDGSHLLIGNHQGGTFLNADQNTMNIVNNKLIAELGKNFPNGSSLYIRTGRMPSEFAENFANGVAAHNSLVDQQILSTNANPSVISVIGFKTPQGTEVIIGFMESRGKDLVLYTTNDFYAKIVTDIVKKENLKVTIAAAARVGETDNVFSNITLKTPKSGATVGVNAQKNNANIWGSMHTQLNDDLRIFLTAYHNNQGDGAFLGVDVNDLQVYAGVSKPNPADSKLSFKIGVSKVISTAGKKTFTGKSKAGNKSHHNTRQNQNRN
ncbi:MAG: hypothetical protein J6039_04035 [Alphaproteobacteria bacterium]|nr:hypothetical protein [Alphaproteobacteria bacterium]